MTNKLSFSKTGILVNASYTVGIGTLENEYINFLINGYEEQKELTFMKNVTWYDENEIFVYIQEGEPPNITFELVSVVHPNCLREALDLAGMDDPGDVNECSYSTWLVKRLKTTSNEFYPLIIRTKDEQDVFTYYMIAPRIMDNDVPLPPLPELKNGKTK